MAVIVDLEAARGKGPQPSLDALQALVADDIAKVNAVILTRMESPVALIPQLAGHIIAAGGKRLRPMMLLGAARMCGYRGPRHIGLAASVEFIHTATLLHDDVVDDSDLRRGQATANTLWGNQPSVLVGDFLFSRAFQLMVADGSLDVLAILSNASAVIAAAGTSAQRELHRQRHRDQRSTVSRRDPLQDRCAIRRRGAHRRRRRQPAQG